MRIGEVVALKYSDFTEDVIKMVPADLSALEVKC